VTIPLLDWNTLENNRFVVTEELEVLNTSGTGYRRPDLVCYVNGMPLAIIEAKRPDSGNPNKSMVDEGISQQIRNQKNDEIPRLFAFSQLLLAISGIDGRYGTTKTPAKFWAKWREEEYNDAHFSAIKSATLSPETLDALFAGKSACIRDYFSSLWSKPELVTEQDKLLISLLSPARLLEFVRFFILFDKRVGKIAARYPQAFGTKALLDRINQRNSHGGREGGVIWHTTGSGKSFTMVYLCKALLMHPSLKDCRIIVVIDRIDLEKQLARTFLSGGAFGSEIAGKKDGEKSKVRSGKELAKRIGKGSERIIFSIIKKFNTASKLPECYNPSDKLIVLIDEGHRSQGGENHAQEQYRHILIPEYTDDTGGASYDKRQKVREDFYAALTEFGLCLKLALSSRTFLEDGSFTEEMIRHYKNDLQFFVKLRKTARQDAQETEDYSAYEQQIRNLVDKQVVGNEIRESGGAYIVGALERENPAQEWSEEKTRNETDLIKIRVKKTIEQEWAVDPYAQKVFSELLKLAIEEAEALFDHPIKQYALFQAFEDKLHNREIDGIPAQLRDNPHARAYYGAFMLAMGDDLFDGTDAQEIDPLASLALETDEIVNRSVDEHSLSPQSIEASITKRLLPRLFKAMGMENAKAAIEKVVHITRVGLSRGNGR
jgi:type I site-specific restriction-modification system R (restriction) subunit